MGSKTGTDLFSGSQFQGVKPTLLPRNTFRAGNKRNPQPLFRQHHHLPNTIPEKLESDPAGILAFQITKVSGGVGCAECHCIDSVELFIQQVDVERVFKGDVVGQK